MKGACVCLIFVSAVGPPKAIGRFHIVACFWRESVPSEPGKGEWKLCQHLTFSKIAGIVYAYVNERY